MLRVKQEKQKQ